MRCLTIRLPNQEEVPMTHPILSRVTRILMMPFLVAAISLNPASLAPSYAGSRNHDNSDDVGAFIAALLGLAAVGVVISNNRDNHRTHKPTRHGYDDGRHRVDPKFILPGKCLRKFRTQFGKERYWGRGCLKKRYGHVRSLPRACRDTVVIKNQNGTWVSRKVYHPRCLRDAGYRKRR